MSDIYLSSASCLMFIQYKIFQCPRYILKSNFYRLQHSVFTNYTQSYNEARKIPVRTWKELPAEMFSKLIQTFKKIVFYLEKQSIDEVARI